MREKIGLEIRMMVNREVVRDHNRLKLFNPLESIIDFGILLWPTPDDFTRPGETSWTKKALSRINFCQKIKNASNDWVIQHNK